MPIYKILIFSSKMSSIFDFDQYQSERPSRSNVSTSIAEDRSSNSSDASSSMALFQACARGRLMVVENMLWNNSGDARIDVSCLVNGLNCGHIAAKKGFVEVFQKLVEYDRSIIESRTSDGRSALMIAAAEGKIDILRFLHNFQINNKTEKDERGNSALHYAAWNGHLDCVQFLVQEMKCNIHEVNLDQMPPIQMAAAGNHVDVVNFLIEFEKQEAENIGEIVAIDSRSITGMNAFLRACSYGSLEAIKALLQSDATTSSTNSSVPSQLLDVADNGNTGLHYACQHGHFEIVEFILTIISNFPSNDISTVVNRSNQYSLTPLHYACIGGYTSIVKLLLTLPEIDVTIRSAIGETPFHLAVVNGKHEISRLLYSKEKMNVFEKDSTSGKTLVEKTLENGFKELANQMVFWSYCEDRLQYIDSYTN